MEQPFKNVDDVYRYLEQLPMFGNQGAAAVNYSLDRIREFCAGMNDPQNRCPVIHVAGTNGKGTVCRMLASVYQSAGYRTGLYTSPHLMDVKERFKINGEMIAEDQLLQFFRLYGQKAAERGLTYFELTTAIAFWYFSDMEVDVAIIETGLGGRLDATNIVQPVLSVITSIGLDHTDILGDTEAEIASEKAGITKPGVPVVTGDLSAQAFDVIQSKADAQSSALKHAMDLNPVYREDKIELTTGGKRVTFASGSLTGIDAVNAATVYSSVQVLNRLWLFAVSDEQFTDGMEQLSTRYPYHAHFEKLLDEYNWYFDGSHNLQAVKELLKQMDRIAPLNEWTLVLGMMADKLKPEISAEFSKCGSLFLYEMKPERAASIKLLMEHFPRGIALQQSDTLPKEWIKNQKSALVIFGGSFYFYSTVRRWMGAIAAKK